MVHVKIPDDHFIKSFRIKLYPTKSQAEKLNRYIDLSRYVYNWALGEQLENEAKFEVDVVDKRILSRMDLERRFTKLRNSEGYEFLKEIPHITARMSIWSLDRAYNLYFKGINKHPKFKKKKDYKDKSFMTRCDTMYFEDNMLRIEGLDHGEKIETKFHTGWTIRTSPRFYKPIITRKNDNTYWISFGIFQHKYYDYFDQKNIKPLDRAIGIDLNVEKRIQLSTGKIFEAPNISKETRQLKRAQRKVTKDIIRFKELEKINPTITKSNRSIKRFKKYQKREKHIANISENFIQTATKRIIDMRPKCIVMEDLDVLDMHKRKYISKIISSIHSNFHRIRFVMTQKCNMYNIPIKFASRYYPSSQLCSRCGNRKKIGSNKIYKCPKCGLIIDRDLNAALNLEKLAYS